MSPTTRHFSTWKAGQAIVAILVAVGYLAFQNGWFSGGNANAPSSPGVATDRHGSSSAYDPASADPKDAIPGGGLAAHEGIDGGQIGRAHV